MMIGTGMGKALILAACLSAALSLALPTATAGPLPELDLDGILEGDDDHVVGEEMCLRPS
jgi:hypothetical protein